MPAVKDRVVQTALKLVIEPIFEREFVEHSYGFRPGRGCKDALREVDRRLKAGDVWVVDADLKSYFDTIPRPPLLSQVKEKIGDGRVLELIEHFLAQDILDGLERWSPTAGAPQGAVISPLLANLYLHPLDQFMASAGYRMVRYADDFVVLCASEAEAQAALGQIQSWVTAAGLTLHPDKTHVGNCLRAGEGFDFLGYRFEGGRRHVRRKSLKALKEKIRSKTLRCSGKSVAAIIADDLTPMLRGWFEYFKHVSDARLFGTLDAHIRRRLRAILCKQQKIHHFFHRSYTVHQRWPNAYFAEQGLFTLQTAHALARQSR